MIAKGRKVRTVRTVVQPPCAEQDDGTPAPDVPAGVVGVVEEVEDPDDDEDEDVRYAVRFPEPYGLVLVEDADIQRVRA